MPLTVTLRKGVFLLTHEFTCIRMYPLEPFRKLHKTVQWFHVPGACRWHLIEIQEERGSRKGAEIWSTVPKAQLMVL